MIFTLGRELDVLVPALGILKNVSFVIPDHDLFVVVIKDVTGIDRNFSAAARSVDYELRHSVTGGMSAQSFDDLDALGH